MAQLEWLEDLKGNFNRLACVAIWGVCWVCEVVCVGWTPLQTKTVLMSTFVFPGENQINFTNAFVYFDLKYQAVDNLYIIRLICTQIRHRRFAPFPLLLWDGRFCPLFLYFKFRSVASNGRFILLPFRLFFLFLTFSSRFQCVIIWLAYTTLLELRGEHIETESDLTLTSLS